MTYELHILKDSGLIQMIAVNETVYEYSFKESYCMNYSFAVLSVNEAGTSASSVNISLARDSSGEYNIEYLTFLYPLFSLLVKTSSHKCA